MFLCSLIVYLISCYQKHAESKIREAKLFDIRNIFITLRTVVIYSNYCSLFFLSQHYKDTTISANILTYRYLIFIENTQFIENNI